MEGEAKMEQLEAMVEGTIYRNAENGYSVVSVKAGHKSITVVGTLPMLSSGEQGTFSGEWIEHPQYGRQFKCQQVALHKPTTLDGIQKYLASGIIHGVGTKTAKDIVACFGEDTLKILDEHPERLQEVPNMGKKRWKQIIEDYKQQQGTREAMVFLQTYGVSASLALKISKVYGERTPAVIRQDPYRLCDDIDGVGFKTADAIGAALGIPADSEGRISAALKYILRDQAAAMGHVYLPQEELVNKCTQLLQVSQSLVLHQLKTMQLLRELVISGEDGDEHVYLPAFDSAEREVATRLCELMASTVPSCAMDAENDIDSFEARRGIEFSQRQREAILMALRRGLLVITGGPGTGKTTIIECIISLLSRYGDVVLCAPTGRAAKRMTEATGHEAKTIHRLLEYGGEDGQFGRNQDTPIEGDCIIADETSMVDMMLMRSFLRAVAPGTRLILVGDADQLPSVGAGNVLGDILQSGVIPSIHLTDIFRQSETSRIVTNAHRINEGQMPLLNEKNTDFFFERQMSLQQTAESIVALTTQRLPKFLHFGEDWRNRAVREIQVLAPMKKGECGVQALNIRLQEALNPPAPGKPSITYGETIFRVGDKVMQTRNDYEMEWRRRTKTGWEDGKGVFNGDVGFVTAVDTENHGLTVRFDEEKDAFYTGQQLEDLDLAYCLSVHKSQGSEFPVVILPVVNGPMMLLTRNLFYTALTRARKLVVLVGREEMIRVMVENDHIMKRYTTLSQRLQQVATMLPKTDVFGNPME